MDGWYMQKKQSKRDSRYWYFSQCVTFLKTPAFTPDFLKEKLKRICHFMKLLMHLFIHSFSAVEYKVDHCSSSEHFFRTVKLLRTICSKRYEDVTDQWVSGDQSNPTSCSSTCSNDRAVKKDIQSEGMLLFVMYEHLQGLTRCLFSKNEAQTQQRLREIWKNNFTENRTLCAAELQKMSFLSKINNLQNVMATLLVKVQNTCDPGCQNKHWFEEIFNKDGRRAQYFHNSNQVFMPENVSDLTKKKFWKNLMPSFPPNFLSTLLCCEIGNLLN